MTTRPSAAGALARPRDDLHAVRQMRAWLVLAAAIAVHVADEALNGFLDVYNPAVRMIRSRVPWLPVPTFTFGVWLGGLIALVVVLAALAPAIRRGGPVARGMSWALAAIMLLNGLWHLAGSVYLRRWLPGATSAPLLIAASIALALLTRRRQRALLAT